ncbi:hypothetical protein P170DRAFT_439961 [Aspergillus steynii IBT 23096]|uniref:Suppressor protein SRP40 n=1 Tax=Aspergillus steynii IBT 23096 TaxID=1392250 RepID=A0A2I2FVQ4_9EURO|nr:uncharacterized protein P170DRAFT_439961 [Aspergillus steynii IBT 23096]PLB44712.1 hypothetical protein P170DRAFT_439961 [Aspergillus steynii IBT 23096]
MTTDTPTTKRLHITPFTPELLPSVLAASVRPLATEVSFHCIPTYPENNYGYVTLPAMEADKVKKKLNGSILKGRKFNVEEARSHKRPRDETGAENPASDRKSSSDKKQKKRKSEDNVLDGYELPSDRKVKRGWTESTQHKGERRKDEKKKGKDRKSSKSQAKSKYTENPECLFRTNIPPNRHSPVDEKQEKQSKKKKKPSQESVVHEFAKTVTHPSFLRSTGEEAAPTSIFVEGKGWVDETGNVKEPASDRIRKADYKPGQVDGAKQKGRSAETTLPSGKSSSKKPSPKMEETDESEDWTSSSGATSSDDESMSSSSSDSESSSGDEASDGQTKPETAAEAHHGGHSDAEAKADGNQTSAETAEKSLMPEVHPLEALFKRPALASAEPKVQPEPNAQFSFFGQDDIESEDETEEPAAPQTPFTKNDLQNRGLRSAAPTPDTALFNRAVNWNMDAAEATDADDASYSTTTTPVPKTASGSKEESDFTKWFWDNRGDNNRAWKKRRRDVAKEQRQRENRKKGMRGKS